MATYRKKEVFEAVVLEGIKNVKEVAEMLSSNGKDVNFSFEGGKINIKDKNGVIMKEGDVLVGGEIVDMTVFESEYERVITRKRKDK